MQQELIINHKPRGIIMTTKAQILPSPACRGVASGEAGSSLGTSTSVEDPLQINPFYAKQTQFPKKSNERKHFYTNGL